jgi:hypothetical protein
MHAIFYYFMGFFYFVCGCQASPYVQNKKGQVTLSNNVTYKEVPVSKPHSFTCKNISENRRRIPKVQKESVFV